MTTRRTRSYWRRSHTRKKSLARNRYLRIMGVALSVILISSFYIYQRVWVRNLVSDIERLEQRNELAQEKLDALKSEWMNASSIAAIDNAIQERKLALEPTKPMQNLALQSLEPEDAGRFAGLVKALEKLKSNIPVVKSNDAQAKELFKSQ